MLSVSMLACWYLVSRSYTDRIGAYSLRKDNINQETCVSNLKQTQDDTELICEAESCPHTSQRPELFSSTDNPVIAILAI